MTRPLLLFVIGLVFGTGLGFLLAGGGPEASHDHAAHSDTGEGHMAQDSLTDWTGPAPTLSLALTPDMDGAMNLHILAEGFTFTPQDVNTAPVPGTGHAHVYVNGTKIGRAYSPWFHIPQIAPGDLVRVTLSANDHSLWASARQPLATEVTAP